MKEAAMNGSDDFSLVPVTTYVHPTRVAQFQKFAAAYASPSEASQAGAAGPLVGVDWPTNDHDRGDAWALSPWEGASDIERARWVVTHNKDWGVTILRALADADGPLSTAELATMFPAPNGVKSVPSVLKAISNRARKVSRRPPWEVTKSERATYLAMTVKIKASFRPALGLQ